MPKSIQKMKKNNSTNGMVTVPEAARILGVFESYVLSLVRSGKLSAIRDGRRWKMPRTEVQRYADRLAIARGKVAV